MITKRQSTNLERLIKEEGFGRHTWIFLGSRNQIYFANGSKAGEEGVGSKAGVYEDDMKGETMGDRCLELGDMLFGDNMET